MVAPTAAADAPGFIAGKQFDIEVLPKITGAPIAKGDLIEYVDASDGYRTAALASINSHYAVAVKPALTADTQVEAIVSGLVTVTADGAIAPGDAVKPSTAGLTAGRVVKAVVGTDATGTIVGRYIGKVGANFRNGMTVPAAVQGDVIIIDLNRRTS
jgi:hypothetical protein